MILVTGTKRSGTSLWMQILVGAGLPHLGEAFPGPWEKSIRDANPRGFYESRFRQGLFYATNPDPETGAFLFPQATRRHVVKVFIPGLVRTDYAYLDKVVATVRPWREVARSLRKLYALEDDWLVQNPRKGMTGDETLAWARGLRSPLPPAVEWFFENYDLIRDIATRRYAVNLCSYARLLAEPEATVGKVLEWLGGGDLSGALAAVDTRLARSTPDDDTDPGVDDDALAVFDALYEQVHQTQRLDKPLLDALNETYQRLEPQFGALSRERGREAE